jgi:16S rRNA (cytosine967-C5)-methyltransferase
VSQKGPAATSRNVALEVLNSVDKGFHGESLLREFLNPLLLSPQDRSLATELVYGVLRWRDRLDSIVCKLLKNPRSRLNPTIRNILRIALLQLIILDRIPPYAAVNEAVAAANRLFGKRMASLVNAILRASTVNVAETDPPPTKDAASLAAFYSHPSWLVESWISEYGVEKTLHILSHNNSRAPLIIRTNSLKTSSSELFALLSSKGLHVRTVEPAPDAMEIKQSGVAVENLPGFKEGLFTVQQSSSQLVARLLKPQQGDKILDCCAAPGGKTAHLAVLVSNKAGIVAIDRDRTRLEQTRDNLARLGVVCADLVWGDAADESFTRSLGLFDKILVDASCSNLGVLRHNPEAKYRATPSSVKKSARSQKKILRNVSRLLKPGGLLVYSVCTVTVEETLNVVGSFTKEYKDLIVDSIHPDEVPGPDLLTRRGFLFTFPPGPFSLMDGFFAARLRRL